MKAKFTYVGIRVTNLKKSIDFYTGVLGMTVLGRGKIEETKGETVGLQSEKDGFILELNYYEPDSPYAKKYSVGEGLDHLAFKVENIDNALKEANLAGYRTIKEIRTKSGSWAYVEDPDGIWIELFQG
jgi:lactoylglutathione lyase